MAGADVVDEHTVVIRTKASFSQLLNSLAHGSGSMVSPTAVEKHGEKGIAQNPVGAGPYRLESFTSGQEVALRAFDGYWGGKPAADRLVFKYILEASTRIAALRTGSVDVIDSVPVQLVAGLRKEPNLDVVVRPSLRPMGLAINLSRPPYDDLRVRRALNHAIPVETIAERVFFGFAKASDSPLAFDTQGYQKQRPYEYSVAKAKALLAEAGFKPGANGQLERDGKPLKMTLLASDGLFPGDVSIAEIAQRAFQQVGIDVTINKIERGAYWDALRQDRAALTFDLAVFGFNPSNASGLYHLESLFKSNADDAARPTVWNMGRYRNPKVDELLAQANSNPDASQAARRDGRGPADRVGGRAVRVAPREPERHRCPQGGQGRRALADRVHDCPAGARRGIAHASVRSDPRRADPADRPRRSDHHLPDLQDGAGRRGDAHGGRDGQPGGHRSPARAPGARPAAGRSSTRRGSLASRAGISATRRPFAGTPCPTFSPDSRRRSC